MNKSSTIIFPLPVSLADFADCMEPLMMMMIMTTLLARCPQGIQLITTAPHTAAMLSMLLVVLMNVYQYLKDGWSVHAEAGTGIQLSCR